MGLIQWILDIFFSGKGSREGKEKKELASEKSTAKDTVGEIRLEEDEKKIIEKLIHNLLRVEKLLPKIPLKPVNIIGKQATPDTALRTLINALNTAKKNKASIMAEEKLISDIKNYWDSAKRVILQAIQQDFPREEKNRKVQAAEKAEYLEIKKLAPKIEALMKLLSADLAEEEVIAERKIVKIREEYTEAVEEEGTGRAQAGNPALAVEHPELSEKEHLPHQKELFRE